MNPSSLVPSLDLCKELKEAGFPQSDTYFYYIKENNEPDDNYRLISCCSPGGRENLLRNDYDVIAAPTVGELGEMLPCDVSSKNVWVEQFIQWKNPHDYTVAYGTFEGFFCKENAKTEADARAKQWLHLRKEGLV